MRILHLNDRISGRGGADWHLLGLIDAQMESGHEVLLVGGSDDGSACVHCPTVLLPELSSRERQPTSMPTLLDELSPDVVHVHNVVNVAVLEAVLPYPALMTVQDHRLFCPGRGRWTGTGTICREPFSESLCSSCFSDPDYFRRLLGTTQERLAAALSLPLIVLSRYMKQELVAVGARPEQVNVIPPFVHGLAHDARPDGPPCVLFSGRLVESKGIDDAIVAWQKSGIELPLVFAGTGSARNRLELAGHTVLGWQDHEALARTFARARAVLFPPRWQEPFGITGLEALSLGVPVVAWRSGGVEEWHPGGDLLVEWGDVDGLAKALQRAIVRRASPPEGYSRDRLMAELHALYQGVAGSG